MGWKGVDETHLGRRASKGMPASCTRVALVRLVRKAREEILGAAAVVQMRWKCPSEDVVGWSEKRLVSEVHHQNLSGILTSELKSGAADSDVCMATNTSNLVDADRVPSFRFHAHEGLQSLHKCIVKLIVGVEAITVDVQIVETHGLIA